MKIKVADEVWIATALLHRENSTKEDFSTGEIIDRVAKENINGTFRPGIIVHVHLHCVANKRPNPANYRLLYETGRGRRRLFKQGDDYHPYREGGKTHPIPEEIPDQYRPLVNWYRSYYK
jgi:hypothetical protein